MVFIPTDIGNQIDMAIDVCKSIWDIARPLGREESLSIINRGGMQINTSSIGEI